MSRRKKGLFAVAGLMLLLVAGWNAPKWYYQYTLFNSAGTVSDKALTWFHSLGPSQARPALQKALEGYKLAALHGDDLWYYTPARRALTHYELVPTYYFVDGHGGEFKDGHQTMGHYPWRGRMGPVVVPADWIVEKLSYDAAGRLQVEYLHAPTAKRWMATLTVPSWSGFPGDWQQTPM